VLNQLYDCGPVDGIGATHGPRVLPRVFVLVEHDYIYNETADAGHTFPAIAPPWSGYSNRPRIFMEYVRLFEYCAFRSPHPSYLSFSPTSVSISHDRDKPASHHGSTPGPGNQSISEAFPLLYPLPPNIAFPWTHVQRAGQFWLICLRSRARTARRASRASPPSSVLSGLAKRCEPEAE
jgi:hypothetical protein